MHLLDNGFSRIRHNFRQCRMVVRNSQKILGRAAKIHDGKEFMNEFRRLRPHDLCAQECPAIRATHQLDESMRRPHAHGLAVISEGV